MKLVFYFFKPSSPKPAAVICRLSEFGPFQKYYFVYPMFFEG